MSVRDDINAGVYESSLPYPMKPRKPTIDLKHATPVEIRAHADAIEDYDRAIEEWATKKDAYRADDARLKLKFRREVEEENNVKSTHPKAGILWNKAWDRGISEGLVGVLNAYEDLVELI